MGEDGVVAGEELGLEDAVLAPEQRIDPGGREGCRAPIPWTPGPGHGWGPHPWLPFPPEPAARSAAVQSGDPASILSLYRRLLRLRRSSPALHEGGWELLEATRGVLVYERRAGEDRRMVVANFGPRPEAVFPPGRWTVDVGTDHRRDGDPWDGTIQPEAAAVLSPARGREGVSRSTGSQETGRTVAADD